jgi:tetratricopeptide (TPR) repeat protein
MDSILSTEGHTPQIAAQSLLALAVDAIRVGNHTNATRLLRMVSFLTSQYPLDEALREYRILQARIAFERRVYDMAWAELELAKPLTEAAKDWLRLGRVLTLMGWVKLRKREFGDSLKLLETALDVLRRAHASRDPARVDALIATATSLFYLGDLDRALRRYEEAASAFAARYDHRLRGRALWGLGIIYRKKGQFDRARAYLLQAKDEFEGAEELAELMRVLQNIGQVDLEEGRPKLALRHFEHALRVMEQLDTPVDRVSILIDVGRARLQSGDHDGALQLARAALEEANVVGDPVEVSEAQALLGRILLEEPHELPAAMQLLKTALAGFRQRTMRGRIAATAIEAGMLLRERQLYAEASEFLSIAAALQGTIASSTALPDRLAENPAKQTT